MKQVRSAIAASVLALAAGGSACLLGTAAPVMAQSAGGPNEGIVKQLVAGNRTNLSWNWVRIGAPHNATAWEARQFETDLGQAIYPVRVSYVASVGNPPVVFVRDYVSTYYAFRSRIKHGAWDLSSNPQPSDVLGRLRD